MSSAYSYKEEWYTEQVYHPEKLKTEPFCICGNLYFVGNKDSATHLVDTGQGLILFDTGYPNMQDYLVESIEKLGFAVEDIRMIFHTHGHFDHFGATKMLQARSKAKTCISEIDGHMFINQPELALCDYYLGIQTDFFTPDILLHEGDVITLGNTSVACFLTPGHTAGAMSYEILVTEGENVYRALLIAGVGFNTLNCDFIRESGINMRGDFEESLRRWKGMQPDIFLGNHTGQSKTLERHEAGISFVDPGAFRTYIEGVAADYADMIRKEG